MIVVAIIGILAAVAIPQYQNYVARAQVAEGLSLVTVVKTAVAEYYSVHGSLPPNTTTIEEMHEVLGLPHWEDISGKYVNSVALYRRSKGRAEVRFNDTDDVHSGLRDKNFYLIPTIDTGSLIWTCQCIEVIGATGACGGSTDYVDEKYLPSSCKQ